MFHPFSGFFVKNAIIFAIPSLAKVNLILQVFILPFKLSVRSMIYCYFYLILQAHLINFIPAQPLFCLRMHSL
jgi:hypothetical protein